jgi:hypothetical protein
MGDGSGLADRRREDRVQAAEPEPEPEPEPEASSDAPETPRAKSLEELSTQDIVAMALGAIDNIDGMSNLDSFNSFLAVDKEEIKKQVVRAEALDIRNSEEQAVQEAFDQMVAIGRFTQEEIHAKVLEVVTGTKCGTMNARRMLLDHNMDVNASMLYYLALVGEGALLTTAAGGVLAQIAVAQGKLERERRRRFEPTERGKLLCIAAARGDIELMKRLLDDGVSPNSVDPIGGYRALHYAAEYNQVPAIQLLLRRGVDIDAKDKWGQMTAFTWAAAVGSGEAVNCLLRAGSRTEARDVIGRTGEDLARVRQHKGVKEAIGLEIVARRHRSLHRHYSTMIKRPEIYPSIRNPAIHAPSAAEEEAERAREKVGATLAAMIAAGPLGTVRSRARTVGLKRALNGDFAPMPPQDGGFASA